MPAFPKFDNALLATLTDAFCARSKTLTHQSPGWSITRDLEENFERFNIDADGRHGQLRLSVWPDGALWFRLCRGRAKNGWAAMLSFHGECNDLDNETLVEQYISSMSSNIDTLLTMWHNVNPVVERNESRA